MKVNKQLAGWGLVTLVTVLVTIFFGVRYPLPEPPVLEPEQPAAAGVDRYIESLWVDKALTSAGTTTLTGAVTAAGAVASDSLTVGGGFGSTGCSVSAAGALQCDGAATVGGLILSSTAITPTAGQVITPTYGTYIVNSAGAVSLTLGTPSAAGQIVNFYGDDANTITINDTIIRSTDGNAITLGQYDLVQLLSTATEWVHLAKSANQ